MTSNWGTHLSPAGTYRIAQSAVPLAAPCKSTVAADRCVAVAAAATASDR